MTTLARLLRISFLVALFTVLFWAYATMGQTETGTVSGLVTDSAGGIVVGAEVQLHSDERGTSATVATNLAGIYVFASVQPARYHITVSKAGFKQVDLLGVIVNVQDHIEQNFHLQLGSVAESITVEANTANINTRDATVSTVVDRQFVENLPLNGRSLQSLISLTPGVVLTKATFDNQGQFSVNGQRANANYFTIDGVSANIGVNAGNILSQSGAGSLPGLSSAGGTNNLVSIDALQEFKIQTSSFAPEFGRTTGGQISITTRSGTNQFHGTLFEYFRNDALDANDWFANANKLPKPPLRQNDFGGVFGGPISKGQTFFFFSYEGLRLRQPLTNTVALPSIASRMSAPRSLQPFLGVFPIPNGRDLGDGTAVFSASYSDPSTLNATSIRIDHDFSGKVMVFGRYNHAPSTTIQRGGVFSTLLRTPVNINTLTLGSTQVLTPRISNELRGNYSNASGATFIDASPFGGAVIPPDSLFFPTSFTRNNAIFVFGVGSSFYDFGLNSANTQRQLNFIDNLYATLGSHQLKIGVDYRRLTPTLTIPNYVQATFFNNIPQAITGISPDTEVSNLKPKRAFLFNNLSIFAQDTWAVSRWLTLTYGLRWEFNPHITFRGDVQPFTVVGLDNPATLALGPQGAPLYKTTYNNFAPRVGAAYQLSQRQNNETVLRAGFGVFYDLGSGQIADALGAFVFPFNTTKVLRNVPFPITADQAAPPPFSLAPPIGQISVTDPNLKLPYAYQWNVALERAVGINQTISASYVAAIGRRLLRQDVLSPNATFQVVQVTRNAATSDYHAMQLQWKRRLSAGLQGLISYTFAHSIDTVSTDSSANSFPVNLVNPREDRGSSDFDVRHTVTGAITYDVPTLIKTGFSKAFLENWTIDTIVTARSATPVNLIGSQIFSGFFANARPDVIPGIPFYVKDPTVPGGKKFNNTIDPSRPNCKGPFCPAGNGLQGTLGRNVLRGFGATQMDFALHRQFRITEKLNLQFKAEMFNILNHPNFGDPDRNLSSGLFGLSTQMLGRSLGSGTDGGLSSLYQTGGPRSVQFAMKVRF